MNARYTANFNRGRGLRQALYLLVLAYPLLAIKLPAQDLGRPAAPDPLHQLSASVEGLVRRVSPSVVQVVVAGYRPLDESSRGDSELVVGRQRSIGSGVIIDPAGYIVTNAHVVSGGHRIQVVLPAVNTDESPMRSLSARGRTLDARIVGISTETDLAVLRIDGHGYPSLPIGSYSKLRQGEMVFAFGSPGGLQNSVTMGVVSAVARQPDPDNPMIYIQTDAPINPGNSGGPLVDVDGKLVGINTFILSQSGGNEGLGFAIPSRVVAFAYPQLRKYGHVHRGQIGVNVQTITPTLAAALNLAVDSGVIISDVLPGGPAASAGIKIQDIVLSLDGRPAQNLPMFGYSLYMRDPGAAVGLEILRGLQRLTVEVPVVQEPHDVDRLVDLASADRNLVSKLGILGIQIDSKIAATLPDLRRSSGVIVAARVAIAGAYDSSLTTGDVIYALNGTSVTSVEGLRSALDQIKPESAVALQVERAGRLTFLAFQAQ